VCFRILTSRQVLVIATAIYPKLILVVVDEDEDEVAEAAVAVPVEDSVAVVDAGAAEVEARVEETMTAGTSLKMYSIN
jgi:hypothetical protein